MSTPSDNRHATPGESPPFGRDALEDWFAAFRERLRAMVALRMDRRVSGRIDPSDVIQETYLEATERFPEYQRSPALSPYLWLRFLAMQRLLILHRRHLQAANRDVSREVPLERLEIDMSSAGLAEQLVDSLTSPSGAAARSDELARVQSALAQLSADDREVLALRHFEQLSNNEVAAVLEVSPATASQKYYQALHWLRDLISPAEPA